VDVGLSFAGGLGVELEKVAVANPPGFTGDPLLFADKVDLKLRLSPLVRGEFRVDRLIVDQPRVRLVKLADGENNFTFEIQEKTDNSGAEPGPGSQDVPSDIAVSFDRLEIHDGRLDFRDESTGQEVDLAGLSLVAGLTNPQPGVFSSSGLLKVDSLLVAGDQPLPALGAELAYDLSFDAGRQVIELAQGDLKINGLPFSLQGSLTTVPDSLRATGEVRTEGIALTDLFAFLTPEQLAPLEPFTIAGDVALKADLEFDQVRAEPLAYEGQVKVTGLRAVSRDIAGELRIQEIRVDFRPDQLKVESDGGAFADQPLDLTLTLEDFQDPRVKGSVSGTFDLAFVEPFLPPERKAAIAGQCRLEGWFSGRTENIAEMDYAGRATFQDVSYRDPALPDALEQLNGTVSFDPDAVTVEKAEARFGAGDLSLTGKLVDHLPYFLPADKDNRDALPKPTVTFEASSRRIDIDMLFPAAVPGSAAPIEKAGTIPDTITAEPIPDLLCQGTIRADTLIFSRVPFTGVSGTIRLRDRILECYDMVAGVYGGNAGGKVSIDLNDLNDPGYSGEFEASDIEANNFLTRFAALSQVVYGKAGLTGSFSARGRDPDRIKSTMTMDSKAALTSGKVMTGEFVDSSLGSLAAKVGQKLDKEQALKDLTTLIKVENGRVGLDKFKTKLGSFGDLTLGGSYGFAGDLEYKGAILLSKDQTARLYASGGLAGSVASLFGDKAERLNLPLTVGGTMTSPKMDIDYTELTNNLKSQLQNELTDDLKDEVGKKLKGLFGK
jgi:uncharacterized protein involved in outer membrane biogenesis